MFTNRAIARDIVRAPLYAIVPYFNPWRWKSRVKHTERAIQHFHESGATIILVEVAFGNREHVFTDSGLHNMPANCGILGSDHKFRHQYIPLRTKDELWLKENIINLGAAAIPDHDWEYVCWLDSDVQFLRPNWVGECIHKLQHYKFLQMFSHARDLGPNYEMLNEDYPHANGLGFVEAWNRGHLHTTISPEIKADLAELKTDVKALQRTILRLENDILETSYGTCGHDKRVWPGLAWACTRQAWEDVGGQFEHAIWGGGDWHMSHALIEKTEGMMRPDLHKNYRKLVNQWYQRCRTHIRRNVGVMEGSIVHHWHGRKVGRGYNTKHAMLSKFGFDPLRHLKKDTHGLFQLHDDRSTSVVQIRDLMRVVARERDEDSNQI